MTLRTLAVTATVSFLTGLASQPAPWITYTSDAGRYSVSLPAQPQTKSEELQGDGTPFLQHSAQVSGAGAVFMVVWADPPIANTAADKQQFLDSAKAALIKTVSGEHIATVPYGNPGIEYTVNMPNADGARFLRIRMFFIGMRAYTLVMMTRAGSSAADIERRFFDSFKVAPQ